MVGMISDDDTDVDSDIDDGFVFDGQLSEDVDAPPNAFDDESFDQGFDRDVREIDHEVDSQE